MNYLKLLLAIAQIYATDYVDPEYPWEHNTKELMKNPVEFVSTLAGWNPDRYAVFE